MIQIETADLSALGVTLPGDRVGMVIAQPHLPSASLTAAEPYRCTEQAKPQELAALSKTLAVARAAPHGVRKTHFTVFPEYSIPGLDGIALVEAALRGEDWPAGTIVIGGTDALTQTEYVELVQGEATHVDAQRNGGDQVGSDRWVNCAITWVKARQGGLERWIQPKLHPAWEEMNIQHQHMFCGSSVYVFKGVLENGVPFRFASLVCFDWIALLDGRTPFQWILADLHQQAGEHQLPLSWLFVIQRNKKPSHDAFLAGVSSFFKQTEFPNALRDRACLVFANTAGRAAPGRTVEFGGCSLVLSPQSLFNQPSCAPTFSNGGPRFRDGCRLLSGYKDVFFRERGACIHSFAQVNPGSLVAGPVGRSFAVENADVFPISGALEPRAPAGAVPASVKWLNDELDEVPSLSAAYPTAPLATQVDASHKQNIASLRATCSQSATQAVRLAAPESKAQHPDQWDDVESAAVEHLLHTLDILGVGFPTVTMFTVPPHATARVDDKTVDVLAIRAATHEACIEHCKEFPPNPQHQVLLVSRDADNTRWPQKFGSILQAQTPALGQEPKITDPTSSRLHLGYQNLLEIFRHAATAADIEGGIRAGLAT